MAYIDTCINTCKHTPFVSLHCISYVIWFITNSTVCCCLPSRPCRIVSWESTLRLLLLQGRLMMMMMVLLVLMYRRQSLMYPRAYVGSSFHIPRYVLDVAH